MTEYPLLMLEHHWRDDYWYGDEFEMNNHE